MDLVERDVGDTPTGRVGGARDHARSGRAPRHRAQRGGYNAGHGPSSARSASTERGYISGYAVSDALSNLWVAASCWNATPVSQTAALALGSAAHACPGRGRLEYTLGSERARGLSSELAVFRASGGGYFDGHAGVDHHYGPTDYRSRSSRSSGVPSVKMRPSRASRARIVAATASGEGCRTCRAASASDVASSFSSDRPCRRR